MSDDNAEGADYYVRVRMTEELHPFLLEYLTATVSRKNWGPALINLALIGLGTAEMRVGATTERRTAFGSAPSIAIAPPAAQGQSVEQASDGVVPVKQDHVAAITLSNEDFSELSSVFDLTT